MDSEILSLQTLASFHVAKLFWNSSFKCAELQSSEMDHERERKWEVQLTRYREEAICKLNNFIESRKLPSIFKGALTDNIFFLFHASHQLLMWKLTYDPCNYIDVFQKGNLYAPNFFTKDGEFDDFSWAEQYVIDRNIPIVDRFSLSCCYWFENECEALWLELKNTYGIHIEDIFNFFGYFDENLELILYRLLQIEYQLSTSAEDWRNPGIFWRLGFEFACEKGFEHAVYYLWEKMSDAEQVSIMNVNRYFDLMSKGVDYPKNNISAFLFSQLSRERKYDLLVWTIQHFRFEIWHNLLFTVWENGVDLEAMRYFRQLPTEMYCTILTSLSYKIKQLKLPFHIELFDAFWMDFRPERKYLILECSSYFIEILAKGKAFRNLLYIIKNLSIEQKGECLFNNRYGAGITILDILSKEKEIDVLEKYLFSFLIEVNLHTQTDTIRKDATLFLQNFLQSPAFFTWCEMESFKRNEKEIKSRINTLQESLILLTEVCEKVNNETRTHMSFSRSLNFDTQYKGNEETEINNSSSECQKRKLQEETKSVKHQKCITSLQICA